MHIEILYYTYFKMAFASPQWNTQPNLFVSLGKMAMNVFHRYFDAIQRHTASILTNFLRSHKIREVFSLALLLGHRFFFLFGIWYAAFDFRRKRTDKKKKR